MNAYLTGIEGMPKLLDCCEDDPMQYFKKKTYADSFQKMYQQHITTFDAIEQGYNTVIDKEQFLSNMAEALAKYGTEKYNSCTKKSQKERYLMDMNLTMAVFVLPMILEFHGNSSGAGFRKRCLQPGNRNFQSPHCRRQNTLTSKPDFTKNSATSPLQSAKLSASRMIAMSSGSCAPTVTVIWRAHRAERK